MSNISFKTKITDTITGVVVNKYDTNYRIDMSNEITIKDEIDVIALHTTNGIFWIRVCGDCCSISWMQLIDNFKEIVGQTFVSITNDGIEYENDQNIRQQCSVSDDNGNYHRISKYYLNTTTKSYAFYLINFSNGYYSGYLDTTYVKN